MDEKEQIEALKIWWKENGSSVITGLLLGLSLLLGGKAWFGYQETRQMNASNVYAQMMQALKREDTEPVRAYATELISNFPGEGHAPLAAMVLAKLAVDDSLPDVAEAQLQWALEHTDSVEVAHTARLRLIRVMIDSGKFDQASVQLAAVKQPGAYRYLYAELEGDLALASGRPEQAAAAYKLAIEKMPAQAPNAAFLTAKYENLAGRDD